MAAHQVDIPASDSTVEVSIIDTTSRLTFFPTSTFAGPPIKGFEYLEFPAYAFLISHKDAVTGRERKVIFDLGAPKNLQEDIPPVVLKPFAGTKAKVEATKYVSEILEDNKVPLESIEAVIWSHTHFDHIGRPSLFPSTTTLITGPGVKDAYAPGYPARPDSIILSREFEGREVKEVDFTGPSTITIGSFKAVDYFGDGSFYFLDAVGHSVGHLNALARTSAGSDSSFILMGADSYHHAGQLRPNQYVNLPSSINLPNFKPCPCPGELLEKLHPGHVKNTANIPVQYQAYFKDPKLLDPKTSPFMTVSANPDGSTLALDIDAARKTITGLQAFDADERVLVLSAHDFSVFDVLEYFPKKANDWKTKGWKEQGRWRFVAMYEKALEEVQQKRD